MFIQGQDEGEEYRMFNVKKASIFMSNILLMTISWAFYKYPQGDEYLVLFMIPLVFVVAPFVIVPGLVAFLLAANFLFFVFYFFLGILNISDIFVLMFLLGVVSGGSFLVKALYAVFESYYKTDILKKRHVYNKIVNELEEVDRKGRKNEAELTRISRLYGITKKLAPALKFTDLLNSLFDFLEANFRYQTIHLLTFTKGVFSRGISKTIGRERYGSAEDEDLDYEKVVEYTAKRGNKPFFIDRDAAVDLFDSMKVKTDVFMVFPLFVGDKLSAILAIESLSRTSYARFRLLVPQIILEFKRVELYEEVQELSIIDGLTEVYLRRYLVDRLEEEVERAGRLGLEFSLAMIDVDHFKECNDRYGHPAGDLILKNISKKLKNAVREVDMIARYGGEEFCILLPETSKKLALPVAERLRQTIESNVVNLPDQDVKVTVSVGVATFPEDAKDVDTIIERADVALYRAKRKGRNMVCSSTNI
ncbi:MAG: GGDEF domain-containing protein [Candidatus Omnitrophota bacterium]